MKEPKMPGPTCPIIDQALELAKQIVFERCSESEIINNADQICGLLEEIRSANEQLRECVTHWRGQAIDAEDELYSLRDMVNR